MKNKYKILSLALIIVLAVSFYFKDQIVKASGSYFVLSSSATATTTVTYLNPTASGGIATSSYLLAGNIANFNSDVDVNDVFIYLIASSSSSGISWKVQYSNGSGCSTNQNGCDWYEEDNSSTSGGTVTHATSTNVWAPGQTGTSTKAIHIQDISSYYKRLVFFVTPGKDNSAIYLQDTAKLNVTGN